MYSSQGSVSCRVERTYLSSLVLRSRALVCYAKRLMLSRAGFDVGFDRARERSDWWGCDARGESCLTYVIECIVFSASGSGCKVLKGMYGGGCGAWSVGCRVKGVGWRV